jgi:hypothetical protein
MILSGLWVFMSAMAILAKSVNTQLHMILFTFIDVTTLFFVSVALYYVFPDIIDGKLMEWSLVKQLHVVCGCAFACLMIYQHIMGITAFLNKKKSSRHR